MSKVVLPTHIDRWAWPALAIAALLATLLFLAALVVGYIGDEYASPPFDEQSVPAPGRR